MSAIISTWVSCYGAPVTITTDRGSQFESALSQAMLNLISFERIRTTAYHPASNGTIERWHRSMKAALMCHENAEWADTLSIVLFGLGRVHNKT